MGGTFDDARSEAMRLGFGIRYETDIIDLDPELAYLVPGLQFPAVGDPIQPGDTITVWLTDAQP